MSNIVLAQATKLATECLAPGCINPIKHPSTGLCGTHYKRMYRNGTLEISRRERGAGTTTSNGYIAVGIDGRKKQQHVLIVERAWQTDSAWRGSAPRQREQD